MLQRREKLVVLLSVNFTKSGWMEMTIMLYELRFKAFVVVFEKPRYCAMELMKIREVQLQIMRDSGWLRSSNKPVLFVIGIVLMFSTCL